MHALVFNAASVVWFALVVATAVSWYLGTGDGDPRTVTTVVVAVALVKTRFVLRYFMEVRHAPTALRLLADAWVIGVCTAILVLYWRAL